MIHQQILENKTILVVDDEPDVLETLEELLFMCTVEKANSFASAIEHLKNNSYDAVILDIMGVRGFELLKVARRLDIPAIMLTAHALSPDSLKNSIDQGADAYVPKDRLTDIALYTADILQARKEGKKAHVTWFSLLKPVFDRLFGEGWRKSDREFWDEFDNRQFSARDDIQKMD